MTDLCKAAKIALDALEQTRWVNLTKEQKTAIQALRQALAQPEQEPVAWIEPDGTPSKYRHSTGMKPLYTAPPKREWVGLTDDEIYYFVRNTESYLECAKGIEAKLKEKNS